MKNITVVLQVNPNFQPTPSVSLGMAAIVGQHKYPFDFHYTASLFTCAEIK
jgi:hypothetical protein